MKLEVLGDLDECRKNKGEMIHIGKSVLKSGTNGYFSNVMANFKKKSKSGHPLLETNIHF